ncbi:hypothetical protein MBUL_03369 [Methylobacterium bullatum]|uniref:LysM domain-containing protein n=1 Tax=Methylobacterium bullatum TaxID=570505 RepID=A0A679JIK6_9HYPH|nr:hypothetical protein MBUL_03369 [Methylobacterium bullatum]
MFSRLSRTLLRVFPAILLVVVGLLAALFRRRRIPRTGATTPVPASADQPVPPVRHRGAALALLGLLLGSGLILAVLFGAGALKRPVSPVPSSGGEGGRPVAALTLGEVDTGRGKTSETLVPGGKTEPGGRGAATAPGTPDPTAPTFDTVRVEPNGDLVVAGRAAPNGAVELLVDGRPTARAVADANGQFAIVPPALPAGNSEIGLRVTDGKGTVRPSRDSVAVVVSLSRDARPLVALTSPDKPTVVLSQPGSPQTASPSVPDAASLGRTILGRTILGRTMAGHGSPTRHGSGDVTADGAVDAGGSGESGSAALPARAGAGPRTAPEVAPSRGTGVDGASTKIVSVESQEGGRLFVTGLAAAGATVRLYLNDTLIAPARVGRDGALSFTIGRGVKPGDYKVRLDQVDTASGKVRSRVEVPFSVPDAPRITGTDRLAAAPSDSDPNDSGGKAAPDASPPMASSPVAVPRRDRMTVAPDETRDSASGTPAAPASSEALRDPPRHEADPAVVFVPEVRTARIERGDSLWAISRRTYGEGDRYTAIYDANQDQIRDPDLIYPGQVFVLPSEDVNDAVRDEKRG